MEIRTCKVHVSVSVCVCMCEKRRERERNRTNDSFPSLPTDLAVNSLIIQYITVEFFNCIQNALSNTNATLKGLCLKNLTH